MAVGQMCLLLPTRMDFGDRTSQMRGRKSTPRCLFGPPDPLETERLLQEQMQRERERFQRKWNVDLDQLERDLEKTTRRATPEDVEEEKTPEEGRIPSLPSAVERLAPVREEDSSRRDEVPDLKICRKPCVKFQKRVRISGGLKRQTHLTEFWRSRRSLGFVFTKSKSRGISLKFLENPSAAPARD